MPVYIYTALQEALAPHDLEKSEAIKTEILHLE